ncbi:hypothetical protein [Aeromonas phage MJG]|uniref:Uncharacterized protein n=1 Tax=Aeromonas phage MJG TaxID=2510451 RepID=A0A5J6A0G7_9CAUD|nr:hypothetical protein [Aeromonas phage MJG]
MPERQGVSLGLMNANRQHNFYQRTSNVAQSTPVVDTSGVEIMNALSKFAGSVHDVAATELNTTLAEDKIAQSNRAAQDMWKAEENRQGIDEGATVAGRLAYNTIMSQHDILNANNKLLEAQQANPEMSPQELEKLQTETYKPILKKYSVDKYSLTEASQAIQSSQAALVGNQRKIAAEYSNKKHMEALHISMNDLLADPQADLSHIVDSEIPARAKALGISEFQWKSALMEEAHTTALNGDPRLYQMLEQTEWSKGSKVLTAAKQGFEQWQARELAPMIGDQMADIERKAIEQTAPWNSILNEITQMNKAYPNTFSASQVASLKLRYLKAGEQKTQVTSGMSESFRALFDDNAIPLAMDESRSAKEKDAIVKEVDGGLSKKAQEMQAQGMDEATVQERTLDAKIRWSTANRMALPSVKDTLTGVANYNMNDYKSGDGKLPDYVTRGLNMAAKMPPATRALYMSNEDSVFFDNYRKFSATMKPEEAYRQASTVRDNPFKVSGQQMAELQETVQSVVDSKTTHGVFTSFFGAKSVPEWQRKRITSDVYQDATRRQFMGALDATSNAEHVVAVKLGQTTQAENGTLINIPPAAFSRAMTPAGNDKPVPVEVANKYLHNFVKEQLPTWKKHYGSDMNEESVEFEFQPQDGAVLIREAGGDIVGRYHVSDVVEIGRKANRSELEKVANKGKLINQVNSSLKENPMDLD